jgi:hypothetical protein
MRSSLVWDVIQHRVTATDVSGQLLATLGLEEGTYMLSRNVGT